MFIFQILLYLVLVDFIMPILRTITLSASSKPRGRRPSRSINYSLEELRSLMMDARITIVNGVMKKFDRKTKTVIVKDHQDNHLTLNYDLLVIGVGLVDNTIKDLARDKAARSELQKDAKTIENGNF
jgi:NADH dehydrogenase FAD-containing subunit